MWPRYAWEPADLIGRPVWLYSTDHWTDPQSALGPRHDALREAIGAVVVTAATAGLP